MHDESPRHPERPDAESVEGAMEERIQALVSELEDAKSRTLRVMADYHNYQKRALLNEQVARQAGVSSVAGSVFPVLDHFDLALAQDPSKASAQQIIDGVKVIREELLKALARHGVTVVAPAPGDLFEPGRHEAIMQQTAEGIGPGRIVATFQAGYILTESGSERVLRPAKVSVSPNA